jgi:cyclopropane fatty-acyl-phospholipid synthase-like methyltransferase
MLDIGCGWGTPDRYTSTYYGAHVTGLTLDKNQAALGNKCLLADEIPNTQSEIAVYGLS